MSEYSRHLGGVALMLLGEPAEKRNDEWRYGSHGSLALQVDKGTWYDFEEEKGGGTLDLIEREAGRAAPREAIKWLVEQGFEEDNKRAPASDKKPRAKVVATYDYVDENGELRYQAVRMEPKTFRQRAPDADKSGGWNWSIKGVQSLPYRLPDIINRPSSTVIIVEGEKDADALAALGFLATCNSGGAGKWPDAISGYFERRNVIIVPDNDDAGRNHVEVVGSALTGKAESIRVAYLPGLPDKGDVSDWLDAGNGEADFISVCKAAEAWQPKVSEDPPALPDLPPAGAPDETNAEQPASDGRPFKALGFDDACYYYLPRGTEQVSAIRRGSHTSPSEMLSLAPLEWWDMAYPKEKGGCDWQLAASDCMRRCERRGVYSTRNIRGRGAWYDNGESVLHLGDRLIVGDQVRKIGEHESQYIYTRAAPMESIINAEAATAAEAKQAFDVFQGLNWTNPTHAWLAAGFTLLAPICGALQWRPHVWLTSQRGAGKSWIQDNIINPLLGNSVLIVQGGTTEAGIRQSLRQDARPVMFDEAESEDHSAQKRMKGVIELARQSSSDSSAEIVKGTVSGSGMAFRIRSMFMMGSINVALSQAADESRFTVLQLKQPEKSKQEAERFRQFSRDVATLLNKEFCASMRARAYKMIPIIRQNAETMSQAVAERLGSQRMGDQVGTLLAGAIAYTLDRAITLEEAREWAARIDLGEAQEQEEISDEMMCLQSILQTQISVDGMHGKVTRALSELVMGAAGKDGNYSDTHASDCNYTLSRHGMLVEGQSLLVSNTHTEIKRILRDTPWAAGWRRILARIPGAEVPASPPRFAGTQTRAVKIPLGAFL